METPVLPQDERQECVHNARRSGEIISIQYEALLSAGIPESLAEKVILAWNLPRVDYTALADAQGKMAAAFTEMVSGPGDES